MASGSDEQSAAATSEEGKPGGASEGKDSANEPEAGESARSEGSSASAIEDVSSLPGVTVNDQDGRKIGEIRDIYAVGEDETPMWVTIESATGLGRSRLVFVPLARIKQQKDEIRVPYSFAHVHESPDVEPSGEISEEDDRALRVYYAIGLADQELVDSAQSYASQVPEDDGPAREVEASSAEGPVREIDERPSAERAAEAYDKQREEEDEEEHRKGRKATADEVFEEDGSGSGDDRSDDDDEGEGSKGDDGD